MSHLRTCVGKNGKFIVGIHKPEFTVKNLRDNDYLSSLGQLEDGTAVENKANFPRGDLYEPAADIIYEIPNAFPFRGATFINSAWADIKAGHPEKIGIPKPEPCSLLHNLNEMTESDRPVFKNRSSLLDMLPHPLLITLANVSTDPEELKLLAEKACHILFDSADQTLNKIPVGIGYKKERSGKIVPDIYDHELFEVVVNNRYLPDEYKTVLVLRPGVQGNNEITGEYLSADKKTHVFEYLRRNSYIPWGHFASNMADDAIRYSVCDLSVEDMKGIRHLYYQRIFVRLALQLDIDLPDKKRSLSPEELETLRVKIAAKLQSENNLLLKFDAVLWGWNFGFGYSGSGHRLNASHQMIHQQNALVPASIQTDSEESMNCFSCGDLIGDFIAGYKRASGKIFFENYIKAIRYNRRTDGTDRGESSLIVIEDDYTMLFVPKAQICEWELQVMTKMPCGNIIQADRNVRDSLDKAVLHAVRILEYLGATFITSIEFSSRLSSDNRYQHLLYSFIQKLPYAPDTFSEAQLRWISGLYPEDFAQACRKALAC